MKKIAVLGSTGMAGHIISCYMEEQGFRVFRISRSEVESEASKSIDVTNTDKLLQYLDGINADVIVNCVGLLQKTCEERPDLAVLVNSYLPHNLENYYKDTKVKLIHLSTDCIFSGKRGNYKVTDLADGQTMYDRSKALGEIDNEKDLTFRMSIIGPDIDIKGTGLFHWFMMQKGTVRGFSNAIWNGVTTLELAEAIVAAIQQDLSGLYQLVPDESINKYQLLLLFQKIFNKKDIRIVEDESFIMDKSLINERTDFKYSVKNYFEQLNNMRDWIEKHRCIYPASYFEGLVKSE